MKKITFIILCLLCAITASALSYASPYKGAGRGGYIYTTSAVHQRAASAGMAQAPVASMASTGSSMGRGIASAATPVTSTPSVRGIQTSASQVYGGITAGDTYTQISGPRRAPGDPDSGEHNWVDNGDGTFTCTICGITISEDDYYDGIFPPECVPISDGWPIWLFLAVLAAAYGIYKKRNLHRTVTSAMRTTCE